MAQPQSAAVGLSPADFYPSPPTSPKAVKVVDRFASKEVSSATDVEPAIDSVLSELPVTAKEDARPLTPAESTSSETEEAESMNEASQLDIWKEALSLSSMLCGATTKKGQPCSNKTPKKKLKGVDDTLKLLWAPDLSSLQVEAHLDSLAQLAHCHYHDHPPAREPRISQWMAVLPGSPRMPSPQKRLRSVFGCRPPKCIAVTVKGAPCKISIDDGRWYYADKTINKMIQVALEPTEQDRPLSFLVKALQYYLLCHVHEKGHHKKSNKYQDEWVRRMNMFCQACQAQPTSRAHDKVFASPPPTSSSEDISKYWGTGFETSKFAILGKCDIVEEDKSTVDEIRDTAQALLNTDKDKSKNEVNDGSVYLYQVPGNENLVKIGFTTNDVGERLKDWKKDCHRVPNQLYPAPEASRTAVPHAHRVERLVHAELMEHRVRWYCDRCGKQHIEWFEVSVERAVSVLEKWSLWMRGRPYEKRETRREVNWYLKEAEAKRFADVPNFLEELERAVGGAQATKQEQGNDKNNKNDKNDKGDKQDQD